MTGVLATLAALAMISFLAGTVIATIDFARRRWPLETAMTVAEATRWLRWTIRCRRGARCARLSTVRLDAPPGAVVRMEYVCAGCGTHYLGEAMALGEGHWSETSRERVS